MYIKELEKRMDNWEEATKIFAAFAELDLLEEFTVGGLNANKLLLKLSSDQINKLMFAITGEEKDFKTYEALGCFNSFLLLHSAKLSASTGLFELATEITAKRNQPSEKSEAINQNGNL
jgi:hypothetical protein